MFIFGSIVGGIIGIIIGAGAMFFVLKGGVKEVSDASKQ